MLALVSTITDRLVWRSKYSIEDAELRRTLQSLACGNKKVLKKRPAGRDVNDADVFYFNREFSDPRAKVHINSIQVKETVCHC